MGLQATLCLWFILWHSQYLCCIKWWWPNPRCCPNSFLKGDTRKTFCQDSRSPGWALNPWPPEHKACEMYDNSLWLAISLWCRWQQWFCLQKGWRWTGALPLTREICTEQIWTLPPPTTTSPAGPWAIWTRNSNNHVSCTTVEQNHMELCCPTGCDSVHVADHCQHFAQTCSLHAGTHRGDRVL